MNIQFPTLAGGSGVAEVCEALSELGGLGPLASKFLVGGPFGAPYWRRPLARPKVTTVGYATG